MSGAGLQPKLGFPNLPVEPLGVAGRDEHILAAVPEQHRRGNVGEFHRPWVSERDHIVYPAVHRLTQRLGVGLRDDPAERDISHDFPIRADKIRPERIDQAL
jgi:hypothetical protein